MSCSLYAEYKKIISAFPTPMKKSYITMPHSVSFFIFYYLWQRPLFLTLYFNSVPILFLSAPHHWLNRSAPNGKCSWSLMLLKRSERFCIWGEMWDAFWKRAVIRNWLVCVAMCSWQSLWPGQTPVPHHHLTIRSIFRCNLEYGERPSGRLGQAKMPWRSGCPTPR